MKTNYPVYFLVFFLCWSVCSAQQSSVPSIDSLKALHHLVQRDISDNQYERATDNAYELLKHAKERNENYYIASAYNSLGHIYIDIKDSARARKNYTLGLEYAKMSKNDTVVLASYNNLGNIYSEIPETTEKGIAYYNKVIELAKEMKDPYELIAPKSNIAWTYIDNGQFEKAYPYLNESLDLMKKYIPKESANRSSWFSQIYMLHGRYFAHRKEYDSAHVYFAKAIDLAEKDSLPIPAAEAYKYYASLKKEEGEFEEAYNAQIKFQEKNDLIFENEKLREMEIANAKFNLSEVQKNLQIAEREQVLQDEIIEKSQEKVIVMVLSSVVLVFILVFLFKINRDRRNLIGELQRKNKQYKEAKDQAENLSLLKTRFFSTVSHEIRTPLYGVIGLTSLLLEDKSLAKHKTDLKSLKFSADYLLALINDVLQMNKMESNEVTLENVSFNIRDLLKSIISSFEFTRVQNKNEIHLNIEDDVPAFLIGDSVRLSQILMNLVGNAMKFTERGDIHILVNQVSGSDDVSRIYFEIKDNGPGIPESKKKVIFEEFSQLENSNYNYQGTGLGLPIVKKLLKLFDSKIKLTSREGEGSTFSFTIAFGVDHSKIKVAEVTEISEDLSFSYQKRILIVDDNRINQVVTKRILEKKEFVCDVAGDGQTAIRMVRETEYDLVLMDVNMPGISGLEATQEIRTFNTQLPILALTAVEVEEIREEIQIAGMSGIIIKPYDVQQFYQIVYKHLSMPVAEKA